MQDEPTISDEMLRFAAGEAAEQIRRLAQRLHTTLIKTQSSGSLRMSEATIRTHLDSVLGLSGPKRSDLEGYLNGRGKAAPPSNKTLRLYLDNAAGIYVKGHRRQNGIVVNFEDPRECPPLQFTDRDPQRNAWLADEWRKILDASKFEDTLETIAGLRKALDDGLLTLPAQAVSNNEQTNDGKKASAFTKPSAGVTSAPSPLPAPKAVLPIPYMVEMDCRVLPSNNPEDGLMIAVGLAFPVGAVRVSDEGYAIALDSCVLMLDMQEVDKIGCEREKTCKALFDGHELRAISSTASGRRATWRLENKTPKRPLRGSYQQFVIARAYGEITSEDQMDLFAWRGSFMMVVEDKELWPFEEGTQEFKVLEQMIKRHELEPADGYYDSYVLATQQLIRSDG